MFFNFLRVDMGLVGRDLIGQMYNYGNKEYILQPFLKLVLSAVSKLKTHVLFYLNKMHRPIKCLINVMSQR